MTPEETEEAEKLLNSLGYHIYYDSATYIFHLIRINNNINEWSITGYTRSMLITKAIKQFANQQL